MKTKPVKIVAIYDNGGKTVDRYTIYTNQDYDRQGTMKECLCLSEYPNHPMGFSQWSGGQLGKHNGRRVHFSSLPKQIQEHIKDRLINESDYTIVNKSGV